ncbi:ribosomal protein L13e-domain-containing protein [Aspergillus californicus]
MSQGSEPQLSQASLAPPVEITRPITPVQRATLSASPDLSVEARSRSPHSNNSKFISPSSLISSDMTPPPSTQIPGAPLRESRSRSSSYLAPSPDIEETLCAAYGASENLPTADDIDSANEVGLRAIAKELLGVTRESRVSALHFKLQYGLLSFRSNVAIQHAEVEHKLARREAEILQSTEYRNRHFPPETEPVSQVSNIELELAIKRSLELERANFTLDRRLRRAKKLIEQEKDQSDMLKEENQLLKKRIRENREHFSRMIEHGPMSPNPQVGAQTPHRRSLPQFVDDGGDQHAHRNVNSNPFAALLAADRVLNRDPSVISTPNRHRVHRPHSNGHVRNSYSLSSLSMTPYHTQKAHQESQYVTPGRDSSDEHRDRDSTISASDIEEAETEEDIPVSQAGSLATSMLRRNPSGIQRNIRNAASAAPKTSTLLQTKLFGQVRKAGVERPTNDQLKRKASFDGASSKKSKAEEQAIVHNNQIQKHHFHKDWQRRVNVHFEQAGRKHSRRQARLAKAAAVAPRPVDKLRPVVRCPTVKYNRRVRAGRGFTLAELKEAGIPKKLASTIGIAVDHRRNNYSKESLVANVSRLNDYKARLILFPRKSGQFKKLDSSAEEVNAAKAAFAAEGATQGYATKLGGLLPITNPSAAEAITEVKRDDLPKGEEAAYRRLREARSEARYKGSREKRAKNKADEEAAAKK